MKAAVLFARRDSVYKSLPDLDVYDEDRDARGYTDKLPVIAHPPCRAWGRLRAFAKPAPHEKDLARFAVAKVRAFGGVLEHPATSTLWADQSLPYPGEQSDQWGGWTLPVVQYWWGHRAMKATWLYIVGISPRELPPFPLVLGDAPCVVDTNFRAGHPQRRPLVTDREREATPPAFADFLVSIANLVHELGQGRAGERAAPPALPSPPACNTGGK